MRLSELQTGEKAYIVKVLGNGSFRKRIIEMGFVRGANVKAILNAPLKDPVEYQVMGYNVSLRKSEASMIEILNEEEFKQTEQENEYHGVLNEDELRQQMLQEKEKTIRVALVGNPNCGKNQSVQLHFQLVRTCRQLQRCHRRGQRRPI
jgi:ferrous iron transport protein B